MFTRTWHAAWPLTRRELGAIETPAHILWGACDGYFPPRHAHRALSGIEDSTFALIPEAGHAPFLEQPELFVNGLREGGSPLGLSAI